MYYYLVCVVAVYFVLKNFCSYNVELQVALEHKTSQGRNPSEAYLSCCKRAISHVKPFVTASHTAAAAAAADLAPPNSTRGTNLFFHETSCPGDSTVLSCSQACSVESAALANPRARVHLLFLSPARPSNRTDQLLRRLEDEYPNIDVARLRATEYFRSTPIELWHDGELFKSSWPAVMDIADVLGILSLWKFGGVHLGLDVLVTRSLDDLGDFFVAEDSSSVLTRVAGLSASGFGHKVASDFLQDVVHNYYNKFWRNAGPELLTKFLKKLCKTKDVKEMTSKLCAGGKLQVLDSSAFYHANYWEREFGTERINETLELIANSRGIRNWNELADQKKPFALLANKYCPRIFELCNNAESNALQRNGVF